MTLGPLGLMESKVVASLGVRGLFPPPQSGAPLGLLETLPEARACCMDQVISDTWKAAGLTEILRLCPEQICSK